MAYWLVQSILQRGKKPNKISVKKNILNQKYCVAKTAKAKTIHSDKYMVVIGIFTLNFFQQVFIYQDTESHKLEIQIKETRT